MSVSIRFKGIVNTLANIAADKFAGRIAWASDLARMVMYYDSTNYGVLARRDVQETFSAGIKDSTLTTGQPVFASTGGELTTVPVSTALNLLGGISSLIPTPPKTSNYTAAVNDFVICDLSGGGFTVTLPTTPDDKSVVKIQITKNKALQTLAIQAGGSATIGATLAAGGKAKIYGTRTLETATLQYQASVDVWRIEVTASPDNFATGFPGIDATTPITNADISINTETRVLTVTPPLGYFNYYTDGNGLNNKLRIDGPVNFPAFTDTSGPWFFYFDNTGSAITTQTPWGGADFANIATVYRMVWNKNLFSFTVSSATATLGDTYTNNGSTFAVTQTITGGTTLVCQRTAGTNDPAASGNLVRATGAGTDPIVFSAWNSSAKKVAEYIEYHQNTIPAECHRWEHAANGTIWMNGFLVASNALVSGAPDADGRNTVIAITSGTNSDENLPYTITNSTGGTAWQQDLGDTTPATLNATNSALFKIFNQNAAGEISFLPATRFPFAWDVASNRPEIIGVTGIRTVVTDNRWFVCFVYASQNPKPGESLKVVCAPSEFTSLVNAQAYNWADIQSTYTIFGVDFELRPLARIIFYNDNSGGGAYSAGCKYSVIREIQDLRKAAVTSTTASVGSVPASSVTFVAYDGIASTNVQSAIQEIADERVHLVTAPATSSSAGVFGEVGFDTDHIYVCTATNTWKRAALTTW